MKLTLKKVKWLIRRKEEGMSSSIIARALKITIRRVNQVWKQYLETGTIPAIGKKMGRPPDPPLSAHEKEIIREAKQKYKLGARRLELLIDRDYGIHIPHNRIHKFLLDEGLFNRILRFLSNELIVIGVFILEFNPIPGSRREEDGLDMKESILYLQGT